jgi:hypothetical protein
MPYNQALSTNFLRIMKTVSMVAGWQLLRDYRLTEERANKLGLKFAASKFSGMEFDTIALVPLDEHLPVYNREAEVMAGSLADISSWLRGVEWSREYDNLMIGKNDEKRKVAEEKYKQRELLKVIRDGKGQEKISR